MIPRGFRHQVRKCGGKSGAFVVWRTGSSNWPTGSGHGVADAEQRLHFPEHVVLPVLADRATIELMLFARLSIVELRRASDSPAFFLNDMDRDEQRAVAEHLAERTEWPGADVPAVCLLDTGVNRSHILIEPTLAETDMAAVKPEWGVADSPQGHGTGMAGLALYGDLTPRLAGDGVEPLNHRLESVKILPPDGFERTEERFYGAVTKGWAGSLSRACPTLLNEAAGHERRS